VPLWVPEPDWLCDWRDTLDTQRDEIGERRRHDEQRREHAAGELAGLQPAVTAARAAWQPYQTRIDNLERHLARELRPAMYRANHERHTAGFGHRHRAQRTARDATTSVHDTEAQIHATRDDGHDVKAHLDDLVGRADQLRRLATPRPAWSSDNQLLDRISRLTTAIDTWNDWNTGQPTTVDALIDSVDTLTHEADCAPAYALRAGEITCSQLDQLIDPLADWLGPRGVIQPTRAAEHGIERDTGLGIDL